MTDLRGVLTVTVIRAKSLEVLVCFCFSSFCNLIQKVECNSHDCAACCAKDLEMHTSANQTLNNPKP